jgi:lysophospholipase L1-like esterase
MRAWFLSVRQRVYWRLGRLGGRVHGEGPLLVAIGDSHTDPRCGHTLPWQVWLRIVGDMGYRTLNLGVSGDTTRDMRRRIEQALAKGRPEIAVVFGGANDALHDIDPAETRENVVVMVEWLRERGVTNIVLIGPGLVNLERDLDRPPRADELREVIKDVAQRYDAMFVDLEQYLRARIERGQDPDFSRVPYRQSRSWHASDRDPHFNAYGQRLIAEAFLAATSEGASSPRAGSLRPTPRRPRRRALPRSWFTR